MVPICPERWCTEANEATQTHRYNPVVPTYPVWAYYAHWRQSRCQEDPVSPPSGGLEKTTRSSPHHVAQHRPTGSETTPPYAPRSSRFGSEPPSVEDDVDVWRYAILELHARNDDNDDNFGHDPADRSANLEIRKRIQDHYWLRQPMFKGSGALGISRDMLSLSAL